MCGGLLKSKIRPNFQRLFEASPALYLVLLPDDPKFTIVAMSDALLKTAVRRRSQLLGKGVFEAFAVNPFDVSKGSENMLKSLRRVIDRKVIDLLDIQRYDLEKPASEGGGFEERYWSAFNSPVLDRNGKLLYIITRSEDVTNFFKYKNEKNKAKNKIKDERLQYEIFSRTKKLQEANEQLHKSEENQQKLLKKLKEIDKLKTQFFSNISHELRTPLTLILGPANKVLQEEKLSDLGAHRLNVIVRNANTLLKHVTDLLDVAKFDEKKMMIRYSETDIISTVRSVVLNFDEVIKSKNIKFNLMAPETLTAQFDVHMIQRVLLNLMSNAIKFTPLNGNIKLKIYSDKKNVFIRVQDSGPGVPIEYQDVIFDRFRQLEEGAARKFGGTGLGLSIAKEFVNLHHGTIQIQNASEGGAIFEVVLPIYTSDNYVIENEVSGLIEKDVALPFLEGLNNHLLDKNKATIPTDLSSAKRNELILVVEDNQELNRFLVELLTPYYRVITAFDGEEGFAKAKEFLPDLILTDIMMPKMSGDQLISKLNENNLLKDTSIILLTAKADDFLKLQLLKEGASDYLLKPFLAEEVLSRIHNLLMLRRAANIMRIDSLLENAMDGVICMDASGNILNWNSKAEHIFGWTKNEAIGINFADLILPFRYREEFRNQIVQYSEMLENSNLNNFFEWMGIKKNGKEIHIELSLTPITTKDTHVFYCFVRDISSRIKTLDELRMARDAAEAANHAKSSFLANMSHEIRTPLGAILGFSELIVDPEVGELDKLNYTKAVKRNGELLSNIINDILDLSRVEAGRLTIESHEVKITEILESVLSALSLKASEKGLRLSVRYKEDVPKIIRTDALRLRQILLNIVGNAIKFTREGFVEVVVDLDKRNNDLTKLCFIVKDTGLGISKDDEKKLFQPFSQADPSTTRQFGGTGLGLVLSKRLAKLLGGDIELIESVKGKGSIFMITIDPGPISKKQISTHEKSFSREGESVRLDGVKVLLAEDSPDNMLLVSKLLKIAGAQVETAENGKVALEKAYHGKYDIILVDIQMPVMDGYQTLSELRKNGYDLPIIALTAHTLKEDRMQSLASGFDDHIGKPVDRSLLINSIANLCHRN